MTTGAPTFQTLSETEAREFLERHHVARIAYAFHDRVGIEPINYVAESDWIYGRTSMGTKLAMLARSPWCAFEVDEVRGVFDWESVVATGTFYLLDPETGSPDTYARAIARLRELVPGTLSADDPVPHRTLLFGVHIAEITGRADTSVIVPCRRRWSAPGPPANRCGRILPPAGRRVDTCARRRSRAAPA